VSELRVDNTRGGKLVLNLDLTVAGLPCNYFSIDAMDLTGDRADAEHQLFKVRMKDGQEVALSEKVEEINADKLHDEKQGRKKWNENSRLENIKTVEYLLIFYDFILKKMKSQKKLDWQ
jgi:hypothetical protein